MINRIVLQTALSLALAITGVTAHPEMAASTPNQAIQLPTHVCPMHPDVRSAGPGKCARCGMVLVPIDPLDVRDYRLEVKTTPSPIAAGHPFKLRLVVRDPDTKEVVREFATVHEKRFHLFMLSQDLEHYDHVHPEQQADGSWTLDTSVPRQGFYKLYADFLPDGGTPQVIPRSLVTGGFTADLATSGARLTPDRQLTKTFGRMRVQLTLPAAGLAAGREEKFTYSLSDASTGAPISDVEPYLGAWGHSLVMSEDTEHFVHAHPLEALPEKGESGGGPQLTFKALLPKPGNYRVWTQIKRGGEVTTAVFTIAAPSSTN